MEKKQAKKRLYTSLMAILIMALETGVITYIWYWYYNTELPKAYYFWGHVFISAVYMAILLAMSAMYGGLRIGSFRMLELLFSQGFSTFATNVLFYAIVCLLAYHFPSVLPLVVGMIIQCFVIGIWIWLATLGYRALFPPTDVLLIYGGKNKDSIVEKVKTRRHQFTITKEMCVETENLQDVLSEIVKHEAVMLWDLPNSVRNKVFKCCYENPVDVYVSPKIMDIALKGSESLHFFDTPLLYTKCSPIEAEQAFLKRAFDIVFSLILLIIASPFMIITAILIKCYDKGSVFYKQVRCTKDDKEFKIIKFRSMRENAESDGVARLATEDDDRITPVGKFIRRTRLDELPQLINVLKGDMSFVGPRPERPEIIAQYVEAMPEFAYRTKVKAGITGYAQIYGKYNTLPYDKLKLDLFYIENFSVWLDLKLVILTVKTLFTFDSTQGVAQGNITPIREDDDE